MIASNFSNYAQISPSSYRSKNRYILSLLQVQIYPLSSPSIDLSPLLSKYRSIPSLLQVQIYPLSSPSIDLSPLFSKYRSIHSLLQVQIYPLSSPSIDLYSLFSIDLFLLFSKQLRYCASLFLPYPSLNPRSILFDPSHGVGPVTYFEKY